MPCGTGGCGPTRTVRKPAAKKPAAAKKTPAAAKKPAAKKPTTAAKKPAAKKLPSKTKKATNVCSKRGGGCYSSDSSDSDCCYGCRC